MSTEHLAAILASIYRDGQCEHAGGTPDGTLVNVADAMPRWAAESESVRAAMLLAAEKLLRAVGMVDAEAHAAAVNRAESAEALAKMASRSYGKGTLVAVPLELVERVRDAALCTEVSDGALLHSRYDAARIALADAVLAQLGGGR